ncbi:MAG: peptide chain release factor N(5)-glutamine methyltransferase [Candidatus Rifleibacteriota bacterium]
MKNLHQILIAARQKLKAADIEDPVFNTNLIAAHLLNCDPGKLPLLWPDIPDQTFVTDFQAKIARRCRHEPLQHILTTWQFLDFEVNVSKNALIPRPESEEMLLELVNILKEQDWPSNFFFADVCTGSGILGIAIARIFKKASGWLTDISIPALELCKQNIKLNSTKQNTAVLCCDLLSTFSAESLDIVISNPPYIADHEMAELMPEVRDYEPPIALKGGTNGLEIIARLIKESKKVLKKQGLLIFEHGHGQQNKIINIIEQHTEFSLLKAADDLCGKERFIILKKINHEKNKN